MYLLSYFLFVNIKIWRDQNFEQTFVFIPLENENLHVNAKYIAVVNLIFRNNANYITLKQLDFYYYLYIDGRTFVFKYI